MKKEIDFAVERFHRIAFGTKKHGNKYISESKLASFVTILTELLFKRYENNWYPENPDKGSGYRCIRINPYCIDPSIIFSMNKANIKMPMDVITSELTIWVDPGVVSVRIGEDGSVGSEIVDEETHKMARKSRNESPTKRSGSVDEDDRSSRSSTPDSKLSDRSSSSSPLLPGTTPNFTSRSPVAMEEYNPYNPPKRVSYPQRYRQNPSPPAGMNSFSPSAPHFKSPSPNRAFSPMAANLNRSPMNPRGSPVSFSPQRDANLSNQGHIPGGNRNAMGYPRPRAIFPSSESNSHVQHVDYNRSYSPYSMYERNMPAANFYDIPAMA